MLNHHDRLLIERSGLMGWLGMQVGPPQAYRERKGDILMLVNSPGSLAWDDDDVAADDEEEEEEDEDEDELLADDDTDDEDDEDDDDLEEEDE